MVTSFDSRAVRRMKQPFEVLKNEDETHGKPAAYSLFSTKTARRTSLHNIISVYIWVAIIGVVTTIYRTWYLRIYLCFITSNIWLPIIPIDKAYSPLRKTLHFSTGNRKRHQRKASKYCKCAAWANFRAARYWFASSLSRERGFDGQS